MKRIAVVGLGYVGLPLALLAEEKGYEVIGVDLSQEKLDRLKNKEPVIDDEPANRQLKNTNITFTDDFSALAAVDVAIICVPTPVDSQKNPDLGPVKGASVSAAKYLKPGSILIVESTINPGVCDEVVIPLIEKETDHMVGKTLHVAHCPERINPGDPTWHVGNINRVVGANSDEALVVAVELYESLIDAKVRPMGSLKEAEAVKVVENSFRDINIAFVNELAMSFHKLGINLENVIDGAATKPFAFMPHRPGCGVGGHCIPVDPYYLIEYAHGYGFEHDFLRLARKINEGMPEFTITLLEEALNEIEKPIKSTKIALLGLSYKANVGDDRESPAYEIKRLLEEFGADYVTFDPHVSKSSVNSLDEALDHAEAIVIATSHSEFREITPEQLKSHGIKVVIDGRNVFRDSKTSLQSAGLLYRGIGV